jgi:UDP-N-acetyl-D-mannosaminuronate dehydrogenase
VILGLTYKPGLDDCRESPSFRIIDSCIAEECYDIHVHDPIVDVHKELTERGYDMNMISVIDDDIQEKITKADVVILATAHDDYSNSLSFGRDTKVVDPSGTLGTNSNFVWEDEQ